ncbi:MAG: acetyl-CoA carboxylase carboxyl transferase subunit beta [Thermoproteota archaeon]|jgi:acetyl-CoA carboxylase carboxyl transferase subunit beta
MGWFNTVKSPKLKNIKRTVTNTPEGLWKKCTKCGEILQTNKLDSNFNVCPYCDHHYRISAVDRIELLVDHNSFEEFAADLVTTNPLQFIDKKAYSDRLVQQVEKTGRKESSISGVAKINGQEVVLCAMDFHFMGGSMGVVTGEKVARTMEYGYDNKLPVVVVSCSGGARMQEGILSLMQMAKTSGIRKKLKNEGIPYISVLTDPTTGGTAASYAMLGDVNIAEPFALIGFAGPRVIEQSIRQTLPEGFQRSEFLLDHGFIDRIVHRKDLKEELSFFLNIFDNATAK